MPLFPPSLQRLTGTLSLLLGVGLLGIAAAGQWTSWGHGYGDVKRDWERFNPALVSQTKSYAALEASAEQELKPGAGDAERMFALYKVVADRFTHDEAVHTLASNWILYAAGFVRPTFRHIWSTDLYVTHGHSLLCDQASYLLLRLASDHGYKARQVGLQGHVVMEVWYEGDWHLYDPDLEVIPQTEAGEVLSLDELARNEPLLQKYYGRHTNMADLIRARENHLFMSMPEGARFEWKGNILAGLEKTAEVLKFLIPTGMIFGGLWLVRRSRRFQL